MDKPAKWCNNNHMNKTILLELTEKEAEVVRNAVARESNYWCDECPKDTSRTLKENMTNSCQSITGKLYEASLPREHFPITSNGLFHILSMAKNEFLRLPAELYLTNKKVEENEFVHISVATALIMWLNKEGLLKKLAVFDYTDHSCDYEEMD